MRSSQFIRLTLVSTFGIILHIRDSNALVPSILSIQVSNQYSQVETSTRIKSSLPTNSEDGNNGYCCDPILHRHPLQRRSFGSIMTALIATAATNRNQENGAHAAVLQSGECVSGEGSACEELAEGNDYIKSLQLRSAANRDKNEQDALFAYQMKNYPDYFASLNPPKYLVMKSDGKFEVFTGSELSELKLAGRIGVEMPKAMGGRMNDVTQKPVMVLRDE